MTTFKKKITVRKIIFNVRKQKISIKLLQHKRHVKYIFTFKCKKNVFTIFIINEKLLTKKMKLSISILDFST